MARSPLLGRRIHVAGSVVEDVAVAAARDVSLARELVAGWCKELVRAALISSCPWTPSRSGEPTACRSVSIG